MGSELGSRCVLSFEKRRKGKKSKGSPLRVICGREERRMVGLAGIVIGTVLFNEKRSGVCECG